MKKFNNIEVLDFNNEDHQGLIMNAKGTIFTASIENINIDKLQFNSDDNLGFDEIVMSILNYKYPDKYVLEDIIIAITSDQILKQLFKENHQNGQVFFTLPSENFMMMFNEPDIEQGYEGGI